MAEVEVVLEVPKSGGQPLGFHMVAYATEALVLLFHCCHSGVVVSFELCSSLVVAVIVLDFGECADVKRMGCCSQGVVPPSFGLEELLKPVGHGVGVVL